MRKSPVLAAALVSAPVLLVAVLVLSAGPDSDREAARRPAPPSVARVSNPPPLLSPEKRHAA